MTPEQAVACVRAHVEKYAPQGEVEVVMSISGMLPSRTPLDNAFAPAVIDAVRMARGVDPYIYPSVGGSLPDYAFTKTLGLPAFVTPYANADEANHAPNENLEISLFHDGIRTGAALLDRLGRMSL
jgi:acetylornithine deacetylase/succinyl-diaminopimelate desuccinylase-like protein